MNERNKGLFPLILGLGVLIICGLFFSLFVWLSQPNIPSTATLSREVEAGEMSSALAEVANIPSGNYAYGGSAAMVPLRQAIEPLIAQAAPQFDLRYTNPERSAPSSGRGIEMVLNGELAFADSSRPIRSAEQEAAQELGFEIQQVPVAIDGIAIAVHRDLDIPGLTREQLRDIYLGYITNWREVGGPNLEVRPFSMLPSVSGTASFFQRRILRDEDFSYRVEIVEETTPVLRQIASIPGGIFYASAPLVVPQCSVKTLPISSRADRPFVAPYQTPLVDAADCPAQRNRINKDAFRNGTYPLMRRLFVVAKKGESEDAIAGQAYSNILLSAEGQRLVEEAGFVSTR